RKKSNKNKQAGAGHAGCNISTEIRCACRRSCASDKRQWRPVMELTVLGSDSLGNQEKADVHAASSCASGSCGSDNDQMSALPDHIRAKVENHPCYSEEAHHYFARMHVAVAPACNIQCHYCNRKYDCSNESRPGVVSEVLTPDQAVKKVKAVAANIPQMTVLGIAGPGDPLANPQRTFD